MTTPRDTPPTTPQGTEVGWHDLWTTRDGKVLLIGLGIAAGSVAALMLPWLWAPDLHHKVLAMCVTHLLVGRAGAMSMGYAQDLGHLVVIGVNLVIEIDLVLVLFPLFTLSFRRLPLAAPVRNAILRAQRAAEDRRDLVHRFGMVGLFVFVWAPFWMTGPVVGSFLGHLMGLPLRVNLAIVLGGTTVAMLGWALFLRQLSALAEKGGQWGPLLLAVAVIGAVLLLRWLATRGTPPPDEE